MFQSPEGDSLFFYAADMVVEETIVEGRFSPPKGIRCFSTCRRSTSHRSADKFQSPEGDSLFFYGVGNLKSSYFQFHVSVPRRGFVVFLRG